MDTYKATIQPHEARLEYPGQQIWRPACTAIQVKTTQRWQQRAPRAPAVASQDQFGQAPQRPMMHRNRRGCVHPASSSFGFSGKTNQSVYSIHIVSKTIAVLRHPGLTSDYRSDSALATEHGLDSKSVPSALHNRRVINSSIIMQVTQADQDGGYSCTVAMYACPG